MFEFLKKVFSSNKSRECVTQFIPYKIVSDDNSLRNIVDNYNEREEKAIKMLQHKLGVALPNDIIWSILQDLSIECSVARDIKLCVNVEYQRGLLLQKEKKYKQAISNYASGLYTLTNAYNISQANPVNHIIDFVTNEDGIVEIAEYKFINKIKLCMEYGNLSTEDVKDAVQHFINAVPLTNISPTHFYKMYSQYFVVQKVTQSNKSHYTEYIEEIKSLKRLNKNSEAISLLKKTVSMIEEEVKKNKKEIPAPWYYEQLAIVYRKEKEYENEIEILEKYLQYPNAVSTYIPKFKERIKKVQSKFL